MNNMIKAGISIAIVVGGFVIASIAKIEQMEQEKKVTEITDNIIEKEVETNIPEEPKKEAAQHTSMLTNIKNLKLTINVISAILLKSSITFFYVSIIGACISSKYWNPSAVCITVPIRVFVGLIAANKIVLSVL